MTRMVVCWALAAIAASRVLSQTVTTAPVFEVATIKPDVSTDAESGSFEHGHLVIRGAPLRHLISSAYDMRIDLVQGGPPWIDKTRFAVEAKTTEAVSQATSRLMLRALLAERFTLVVHNEEKATPVLVLKVGKRGAKLQTASTDAARPRGCFSTSGILCHGVTMRTLADALRRLATGIDTPVVDETGILGAYDLMLDFSPPNPPDRQDSASSQPNEPIKATIFSALQEQLGLELQKAIRPIGVLVVDHVEPLTPGN